MENTNTTKRPGDDFDINPHLIALLKHSAFWAEISQRVQKIPSRSIGTAGVAWNKELDNIVLYYNPDFMATLTPNWIKNILIHEFSHIVYGHVTTRRMKPNNIANCAMDLAINSIIYTSEKVDHQEKDVSKLPLPPFCLVPSRQLYQVKEGEVLTDEIKTAQPVAQLIEQLPIMRSSEEYFIALNKIADKMKQKCPMCGGSGTLNPNSNNENSDNHSQCDNKDNAHGDENNDGHSHDKNIPCPICNGKGTCDKFGFGSVDNHDLWDNLTDEQREYVKNRIQNIVEKAVRKADATNGWGNIPADIASEIRRSVSNVVPWRSVLRQFIGQTLPGDKTSSIKKINRRYPYIHAGVKKSYRAKMLIAIDQSGSVDDEMLGLFFGELTNLAKNCDIWILPFDCSANEKEIYKWSKGRPPPKGRMHCGGTNFDAPTELVNDAKMRDKFDAMLIITDGQAPAPKSSRIQRGWVLAPQCKLNFESTELQVFIDKNKPLKGAWR